MATPVTSISLSFAPLGTLGFASVSASYASVITLQVPARVIILRNQTDHDVIFQFSKSTPASNGTNDGVYIATGETLTLDVTSNRSEVGGYAAFSDGTKVWVRAPSTLPTTGSVWVSYVYALTN